MVSTFTELIRVLLSLSDLIWDIKFDVYFLYILESFVLEIYFKSLFFVSLITWVF